MDAQAPKCRWRWLLTGSLIACAGFAVIVVVHVARVKSIISERREFIEHVMHDYRGGMGTVSPGSVQRPLPFGWSALGARAIQAMQLPSADYSDEQLARLRRLFPEADIDKVPSAKTTYIFIKPSHNRKR
jgi:hypothetical protein